jgi:hypothetical protein
MNYSPREESEKNKAAALAGANGFENNLTPKHNAKTAAKQSAKKLKSTA